MTEELLAHLKRSEGLRLQPYKDVAGWWTVGYGHKLPEHQPPGGPITEPEADALLRADAEEAERAALHLAPELAHEPRRLAALTDLIFNVGAGAVTGSGTVRELRAGNWPEAARRFRQWNKARVGGQLTVVAGLSTRREVGARWIEQG